MINPRFLLIAICALFFLSCNKVILIVDEIPPNTPPNEPIFLSGSFNNWKEADYNYVVKQLQDGRYGVVLPALQGRIEYKFSRGSWLTVETDSCGNSIPNRELEVKEANEIVVSIKNWKDRSATICNYVSVFVQSDSSKIKPDEDLYLVGNHNNWKLFDPMYKMTKISSGLYKGRLPKGLDLLEFKVTRGDWTKVEVDFGGSISAPHTLDNKADSMFIKVPFWNDYIMDSHPRLTVVVHRLPPFPEGEGLYLASNINNWDPSAEGYAFEKLEDSNHWALTIPRKGDRMFFKITRGNWSTVEGTSSGSEIENREWVFGKKDTVFVRVEGWRKN